MPDVPARPMPDEVEGETCTSEDHPDCIGVQLTPGGPCLAHAPPEDRELALAIFHAGANLDATRGCEIDPELLAVMPQGVV